VPAGNAAHLHPSGAPLGGAATPVWNPRPMAGRAMLTTVASRKASPEPSAVTAATHRPGSEENDSAGASLVVTPGRTGI
jgi:hypothetical protein